MLPITLASSSPYRRQLMQRLRLPFTCYSPDIDESAKANETPSQLAARLSEQKAYAAAEKFPEHLIIASDQVASVDNKILTKPGNYENARQQLLLCNGKQVTFHTGLAVLNTASDTLQSTIEPFIVQFRHLPATSIERYLTAEQPYDCAGSFKMEGLGIALFEQLKGEDPNSLIGLPLIKLVTMLNNEGYNIP